MSNRILMILKNKKKKNFKIKFWKKLRRFNDIYILVYALQILDWNWNKF